MSKNLFWSGVTLGVLLFLFALIIPSRSDDRWAQADPARREWFKSQKINPDAKKRLNIPYDSCCDNGDVFRTRFRVGKAGQDVWEYLDSDGSWKVVPEDIISDQPSLDGQPILFKRAFDGAPVCFYKPNGGT